MELITGGTSRLGREIVKRLEGDVLVHYYENKKLAEELSPYTIQADMKKDINGFFSFISKWKFDVIINNLALYGKAETVREWESMMRVNVILPALLMDHIDKGVVVNISSICSYRGVPSDVAYGVSKAALNRLEGKPGVRVVTICPAQIGKDISVEEVADEVIRVIKDESVSGIIDMWGTYKGLDK